MGTFSEKLKGSAKELVGDVADDEQLQQEAKQKAQEAAGHAGAEKKAS